MAEQPGSIYFDNASTSWPKSPLVAQRMREYLEECGLAYGRSSGRAAEKLQELIDALRHRLAFMLGAQTSEMVFTYSATDALNLAIQGLLVRYCCSHQLSAVDSSNKVPLVVTSRIEHNSVLRPLQAWVDLGRIRVAYVPCDESGRIHLEELDQWLDQRPLLVCLNHASNVTGVVQDLSWVGKKCREVGAVFLIDAAQTCGYLPINVRDLECDVLVTAGHKGLGGPLGTGVAYFRTEVQSQFHSLRQGGTGALPGEVSAELLSPFKWEAGNHNVPGLVGLAAAVESSEVDAASTAPVGNFRLKQAQQRCSELWKGLSTIAGVRRIAEQEVDPFLGCDARMPIISITADQWQPTELALALESAGGFITRAGYHCAPLIHETLGTVEGGTLRISPSSFNSVHDVERLLETMEAVCRF